MLIVTGYMHVDPFDLPRFHAELQAAAVIVRQRPGNLSMTLPSTMCRPAGS